MTSAPYMKCTGLPAMDIVWSDGKKRPVTWPTGKTPLVCSHICCENRIDNIKTGVHFDKSYGVCTIAGGVVDLMGLDNYKIHITGALIEKGAAKDKEGKK